MGLQLIFVVETNKKCKSDWIYIKDTIDRFFQYNQAQVKLTPVYMDGKGNYKNKETKMSNIKSTEEAKKAILRKIVAKLSDKEQNSTVCAARHGAHLSHRKCTYFSRKV